MNDILGVTVYTQTHVTVKEQATIMGFIDPGSYIENDYIFYNGWIRKNELEKLHILNKDAQSYIGAKVLQHFFLT